MDLYKRWVQRVRQKEYADELIVAAAAIELEVRVVCVPFTPATDASKWKISEYCPLSLGAATQDRNIFLSNNDAHYMWLAPF